MAHRRAGRPPSRRHNVVVLAADALYTVGFTAGVGQTPGQMAMGIRVVDRRSGGPPTWTQVTVRWLVSAVLSQVPWLLFPPPFADAERHRELQSEMKRLEVEHADDRQRLNEELLDLYRRSGGSPAKGLGRVALSLLGGSADHLVTLRDPLRRCLHDRAAGTIVVEAARQ